VQNEGDRYGTSLKAQAFDLRKANYVGFGCSMIIKMQRIYSKSQLRNKLVFLLVITSTSYQHMQLSHSHLFTMKAY